MRYIILFVLGLFGYWWLRRKLAEPARSESPTQTPASAEPERMHACAHCGVHVPESECVSEGERYYCGDAHRRLGPRA